MSSENKPSDVAFKKLALDFIDHLPKQTIFEPYSGLREKINAIQSPNVEKKVIGWFKTFILALDKKITELYESKNEQAVFTLEKHKKLFTAFTLKQEALLLIGSITKHVPPSLQTMLTPLHQLRKNIESLSIEENPDIQDTISKEFNEKISQYQQNFNHLNTLEKTENRTSQIENLKELIKLLSEFITPLKPAAANSSKNILPQKPLTSNTQPASDINWNDIPHDLWNKLFYLLEPKTLTNLTMLSKLFNKLVIRPFIKVPSIPVSHGRPLFFFQSKKENLKLSTAAEPFGEKGDYLVGDRHGHVLLFNIQNEIKLKHKVDDTQLVSVFSLKNNIIATISINGYVRFWKIGNNSINNHSLDGSTISYEYKIKGKIEFIDINDGMRDNFDICDAMRLNYKNKKNNNELHFSFYCLARKKSFFGGPGQDGQALEVEIWIDCEANTISVKNDHYSQFNPGSTPNHFIKNFTTTPYAIYAICDQHFHSTYGNAIEAIELRLRGLAKDLTHADNSAMKLTDNEEAKKMLSAVIFDSTVVWIQKVESNFLDELRGVQTKFKSRKCTTEEIKVYSYESNDSNDYTLHFEDSAFILPWQCENSSQRMFAQRLNEPNTFIVAQDKKIKIYRFEPNPNLKENEDYFTLIDQKRTTSTIVGISETTNGNLLIACEDGVQHWNFQERPSPTNGIKF